MEEFKGRVAVITGGASGIGRSLADRCALEEMSVVLADIDRDALNQAECELKATGARVLAVRTDVSKADEVEGLARKTLESFGAVHLLFNNAGVETTVPLWEATEVDWHWVLGVNLWGVIHGIRTFVPIMLKQGDPCHVVNTSSMAGLISGPGMGLYKVAKHGVVSMSETLACDLAAARANVKVSVLCPAGVNTRILESDRTRPSEFATGETNRVDGPAAKRLLEMLHRVVKAGLAPSEVADAVFDGIRKDKFYILTHPEWKTHVRARMENILLEKNPNATIG